MPVVGASIDEASSEVSIENISYTETELKNLYNKYNITDNDLKFAKNRLPNYLEGTILDSNQRVIASENGKPPENLKEGEDYDIIITHEKMFAIIDEEREKYIQNYGVDPENPKIEIINNYAIPKEEINKLAESGKISFEINTSEKQIQNDPELISNALFSTLSVSSNPYAIDEIINEYIFVAKDSRHKPTEAITQDTHDALYRFEDFGIGVNTYWYWNSWDASDVSPAGNSSKALADLKEDTSWVRDSSNDIVIGWTHNMDNNGRAYRSGAYAVCTDTADGVDWPHDSIVQHEVSHNFDALDQNSDMHPACIMNYASAYAGIDVWCTSCANTVDYGIDN